jgi:hypothetical protein
MGGSFRGWPDRDQVREANKKGPGRILPPGPIALSRAHRCAGCFINSKARAVPSLYSIEIVDVIFFEED